MEKETSWIMRNLLWIFLIVLIGLFSLQWYLLNKSINTVRTETKKQIIRLENSKTNLIELENVEKDSLNYIFNAKDIAKINKNLDALASEIYQERNKAEAIIDKDIDRLNLYMAIGIGFLALLGVFVPVLVNVLSNDDLNKKQEVLNKKFSKIELEYKELDKAKLKEAILNASEAIEKSKEIDNLNIKTDKILPKLPVISLQIAIHSLFNQSSLALNDKEVNKKQLFSKLFSNVKNDLEKCQVDLIVIRDNRLLQQTLENLANLLSSSGFKYTSYVYTRRVGELSKILEFNLISLSKCSEDEQTKELNKCLDSFNNLIEEINRSDAETGSKA